MSAISVTVHSMFVCVYFFCFCKR